MKSFCFRCATELIAGANWTPSNQRSHRHVCSKCCVVAVRRSQALNPERVNEARRAYKERHPDRVKAQRIAWEERNREYKRSASRAYYAANRETILAKAKARALAKKNAETLGPPED